MSPATGLTRTKRAAFAVITLLLCVGLLEVGARLMFAARVGPSALRFGFTASNYQPHPDPSTTGGYLKYRPHEVKFDEDGTGARFRVAINSRGFRGGEYTAAKTSGVVRVVTLGGSSTFGYTDRDDETYPYYLQGLLNDQSHGSPSFEVINLGIPHVRSDQILALFLAEALPLHPDVVTFYEGVNDSKYGTATASPVNNRPPPASTAGAGTLRTRLKHLSPVLDAYRAVRDHLIIVSFVDSVLLPNPVLRFSERQVRDHMEGKSEAFLKNVSRINDECLKRDITFIVASQQAKSLSIARQAMKGVSYRQEAQIVADKLSRDGFLTPDEVFFLTQSKLMTDLQIWANAHRVPFVDVIRALDADRDVLVSWVHLSPKGNRLVADAFANEILRQVQAESRSATMSSNHLQ